MAARRVARRGGGVWRNGGGGDVAAVRMEEKEMSDNPAPAQSGLSIVKEPPPEENAPDPALIVKALAALKKRKQNEPAA